MVADITLATLIMVNTLTQPHTFTLGISGNYIETNSMKRIAICLPIFFLCGCIGEALDIDESEYLTIRKTTTQGITLELFRFSTVFMQSPNHLVYQETDTL